jgi:TRAP-type C4-dicarboxylate transport system permease small subunit
VSEKDDATPEAGDVPPTRKHDKLPESDAEPPVRESHVSLESIPDARALHGAYPDDGAVAETLRKVDYYVGIMEQTLLFVLLSAVVLVAAAAALSGRVFGHQIGRWWHYIVRNGTFTIAMFAAAFASHQQRHLAMDLVSRRLTPRGRLILGLILKAFVVVIALVLMKTGWALRGTFEGATENLDLGIFKINDADTVAGISVAAALIIFHSVLHAAIDVEYLVRGKLPPERARSGH